MQQFVLELHSNVSKVGFQNISPCKKKNMQNKLGLSCAKLMTSWG
jgi:hypothetical protein